MVQKIKFLSKGFSVTQSRLAQWMDGLASSLTAQPTGWVVVSLAVYVGLACQRSHYSSCNLRVI